MKRLIFTGLLILSVHDLLNAQTILLQEDFSTASGTTPPAGWTIQTTIGDPIIDVWHFDNPGRRTPNSPVTQPFASFDSDKLSDNSLAEEIYLISPPFNAITTDNIILEFDQCFFEGFGGGCAVEVYDGASWTMIYTNTFTTSNPTHSVLDITAIVQNTTNVQIRFRWTGDYSWYWIIDNIKIATQPIVTDQFTEQTEINLPGVANSSAAWGDYDNDGDLDILLTGNISKIYRNNGDNTFTEQTSIILPEVDNSSVTWGDFDNDSYLDILLTGQHSIGQYLSKIYHNNGNNTFSEQTEIMLTGVTLSSVALGDYNNDGYLDILLTGQINVLDCISKIYQNNGDNTFTEQTDIVLMAVYGGSVAWGDYDNDGDLDIILTGNDYMYQKVAKIYRNNGDNTFTEQTDIDLMGVYGSSVAWGDYDDDSYLDILLTGHNGTTGVSKIYRNNGNLTFTWQTDLVFTGFAFSSVAWGDYDNDGDLDILFSGVDGSDFPISKIYSNNNDHSFTEESDITLSGVKDGSVTWCDYDNDSDLDILITGYRQGLGNISKIYKNNIVEKNTPPAVPQSIVAHLVDKYLYLSWDKSTDAETPQLGLTYNLRIGTSPGGGEIMSPMALTNGKRTITSFGNVQHNTNWTIDLSGYSPLPEHIFYSVQAIDNGFMGSGWSPEKSEISDFVSDFLPNSACQKNEVLFQDESYSIDYPITSWQWKFIENGEVKATSTLQSPSYSFQTHTGTHEVELTITNSNDETVTRTKSINVLPSPLSDFTALPVCQGTLTSITNTTQSNSTNITGWLWNFGDGTPNSTVQNPVNHSYSAGTHNLSLTVSANNSCSLTTTKEVLVAELPSKVLSITGNTVSCSNENTLLSAEYKSYYSYQWKANGANINDSIKFKLYPKSSGSYSLKIINTLADNCITESDPVSLTVKPSPPTLSISGPQETSFCLNDPASQIFAPLVGGLTYNWMVNGNLASSGSNTYLPQQSGIYTLIVSNSDNCSQPASNSIPNFIINPIPAVPNVTSPTPTFCSGTSFIMQTPYSNELAYQWLENEIVIPGAILNSYSPSTSGKYSVKITKNNCSNTSLPTDVNVLMVPSIPSIIALSSTEFCQGDSVVLSAPLSSELTYKWKLNGGDAGPNKNTYISKLNGIYSLEVVNSTGCSSISANTINVKVNPKPSLPSVNLSGPTTFCLGGNVELSVTSISGYAYQWENNGAALSGAVSNAMVANTSGVYSLRITNTDNCYTKTENVTVNVLTKPSAPTISAASATTFCQGDSVLLSVTETPGYTYQWRLNGGSVGTNSNQFVAKTSGSYDLVVSNSIGCFANSAAPVTVTVKPLPVANAISLTGSSRFCSGQSALLSVPVNTDYSYSWKNGTSYLGITTNSVTVTETGDYTVEVSLNGCLVTPAAQSIEAIARPARPDIDMGAHTKGMCLDENPPKLAVDNIVPAYSYQWYKNETPMGTETSIEVIEAGNYYLEAVMDICRSERDTAIITFAPAPAKPEIIVRGPSVYLLSTTSKTALYKWYFNGSIIPEADQNTYLAGQNYGLYRLAVANETGCLSFSDTLRIPLGITGIEDTDPFEDVKIYPNPTTGMFTIEMNNNVFGDLVIDIITQNGSKILNIKFEKTTQHFMSQIDLSGQSKGMYLINLSLDKFRAVRKVLVE